MSEDSAVYQTPLEKWRAENPDHVKVVRTPWRRLRDKNTRASAIVAKCHDCMGWGEKDDRPPGVMEDIRNCTCPDCPLYQWRPYK